MGYACCLTSSNLYVIDLPVTHADRDRDGTAADFTVNDKYRATLAGIEDCFKVFATVRTGNGDEVLHSLELVIFVNLPQRFFEGGEKTIDLVLGYDQWRLDAQDPGVDVGAADEDLARELVLRDFVAEVVVGELHAEHETSSPTKFEDLRILLCEIVDVLEQVFALAGRL